MRSQDTSPDALRQWRPKAHVRSLLGLAVFTAFTFSLGLSQMPPLPGASGTRTTGFPALPENANPHPDGIRALQDLDKLKFDMKQIEELNALRHKELTSDTAKLLALAGELKIQADKGMNDPQSMTAVQKVEQIEKLAREVQAKMKATVGN